MGPEPSYSLTITVGGTEGQVAAVLAALGEADDLTVAFHADDRRLVAASIAWQPRAEALVALVEAALSVVDGGWAEDVRADDLLWTYHGSGGENASALDAVLVLRVQHRKIDLGLRERADDLADCLRDAFPDYTYSVRLDMENGDWILATEI